MPSVLRTFVLGGVLGVGIVSGGAFALAQTSPGTAPVPVDNPGTTTPAPGPADDGPGEAPDRHGHGPHRRGPHGTSGEEGTEQDGRGRHGRHGHPRLHASEEALAAELGVTVEQLREARTAARQAVKEMGPLTKPATRPPTDEEKATRATELEARAETFTRTLAEKLGVTTDRLRDAHVAVVAKRLDEAVAAGNLTRERADELLAKVREGAAKGLGGLGRGGLGHRFGGGHGPGHRGG